MLKQFAVSTENYENCFLNFRIGKIGLHRTHSSGIVGLSMQRFGGPALAGGVFYFLTLVSEGAAGCARTNEAVSA